jgi:hypothetical protein
LPMRALIFFRGREGVAGVVAGAVEVAHAVF